MGLVRCGPCDVRTGTHTCRNFGICIETGTHTGGCSYAQVCTSTLGSVLSRGSDRGLHTEVSLSSSELPYWPNPLTVTDSYLIHKGSDLPYAPDVECGNITEEGCGLDLHIGIDRTVWGTPPDTADVLSIPTGNFYPYGAPNHVGRILGYIRT